MPLRIAYSDGTDLPSLSPSAAASLVGMGGHDVEIVTGFSPRRRDWFDDPTLRGHAVMAGYALSEPIAARRLTYMPLRLSAVPRFVRDTMAPKVAVVSGVRRGRELAYAENVGWAPAAVAAAETVIVEVVADARDVAGPLIDGPVAHIVDAVAAGPPPSFRAPDEIDRAIAGHVVRLLPDRATVQLGPGGVPDAIVAALDRPVQVWSGVVTDSVGLLVERGLLLGDVTAAYTWGGPAIDELARTGRLRLVSVEVTHDLTALSSIPRFVGLNTALQLALDGSVNVERVGGKQLAGIGGHSDFCAGASRSPGGVSIVALRSTAKGGASTIVPRVETVSTSHSDVEVVVTEHGVADLRGCDDEQRAQRIVDVAAPEHRAALRGAVRDLFG